METPAFCKRNVSQRQQIGLCFVKRRLLFKNSCVCTEFCTLGILSLLIRYWKWFSWITKKCSAASCWIPWTRNDWTAFRNMTPLKTGWNGSMQKWVSLKTQKEKSNLANQHPTGGDRCFLPDDWGVEVAAPCARTLHPYPHILRLIPDKPRLNSIYYAPQRVNTTPGFVRFRGRRDRAPWPPREARSVCLQRERKKKKKRCDVDATTTFGPQTANLSLQPWYRADILRNTLPYFQTGSGREGVGGWGSPWTLAIALRVGLRFILARPPTFAHVLRTRNWMMHRDDVSARVEEDKKCMSLYFLALLCNC